MTSVTRSDLWARLSEAGLVQGEMPAHGEAKSPWFVRIMLGFAGWLGALFLLGFVGAAFAFVWKSAAASLAVGAGACAAAVVIFRAAPRSDFVAQFGLAVSLAGQALLVFGLSKWFGRSLQSAALVFAIQEAVLFFLVPNTLHRVLCAWWGALALAWVMIDAGFYAFAPAVVTAGFLWVWLAEFDFGRHAAMARAGGYGLALASVQAAVMHGSLWWTWMQSIGHRQAAYGPAIEWLGHAASAAVLLWAVIRLLSREGLALGSGQGRIGLAGALILGAASLKAPGVGPAAAILVVGYANGNRVLAGLGVAALLGYLSHYYYSLQATLLEKSAILAATGLALLAARLVLHRWWPEQETEATHA
ncbi:MAG: DUF4401 domain-containing protein [Pseudomonadota bacterium]